MSYISSIVIHTPLIVPVPSRTASRVEVADGGISSHCVRLLKHTHAHANEQMKNSLRKVIHIIYASRDENLFQITGQIQLLVNNCEVMAMPHG